MMGERGVLPPLLQLPKTPQHGVPTLRVEGPGVGGLSVGIGVRRAGYRTLAGYSSNADSE